MIMLLMMKVNPSGAHEPPGRAAVSSSSSDAALRTSPDEVDAPVWRTRSPHSTSEGESAWIRYTRYTDLCAL
jgi:hypothetical protein